MKNLLICISSLNIGGAEKQAIEDANMLSAQFNVYLLVFQDGPMKNIIDDKVLLLKITKTNYIHSVLKIKNAIEKYKIDLLHAHLYAPMVLMALAGQISRKPVIWNFHSHAYENSFKAKVFHRFTSNLPFVKKILFPSNELIRYYKSEGYSFNNRKIEIAYNSGQVQPETLNNSENSHVKNVRIGYVGRLVELKRVEYLIELAEFLNQSALSNYSIEIVGDGPELKQLTEETTSKELNNFITFHGFQTDTISFYKNFDIFVLPSREEVLSLSLIDAGLASLPSVAFNIGGNDDIIKDGNTGFLVDTKELFFNRIADLVKNPKLRNRIGIKAQKECNQKFSPVSRKNYLLSLYARYI